MVTQPDRHPCTRPYVRLAVLGRSRHAAGSSGNAPSKWPTPACLTDRSKSRIHPPHVLDVVLPDAPLDPHPAPAEGVPLRPPSSSAPWPARAAEGLSPPVWHTARPPLALRAARACRQLQEGLHLLPWRRPDGTRTARARPPPGAAIARRGQSLLRASSPPAAAGRIPSRPPPAAPATPDPRRRGRSSSGRRARVHSREPAPDHRRRAGEAGDSRCRPWLITPDQPETFVGALTR